MSFLKCYDVVSMVIDEANNRFAPLWKPDNNKLDMLKQYCEAIDSVSEEFGGESYDVEVNEITMEICITLECQDEIIIETDNHILYELAKRAVKYGFSCSEEGSLLIKLVFPSIWEKA